MDGGEIIFVIKKSNKKNAVIKRIFHLKLSSTYVKDEL